LVFVLAGVIVGVSKGEGRDGKGECKSGVIALLISPLSWAVCLLFDFSPLFKDEPFTTTSWEGQSQVSGRLSKGNQFGTNE
jgi:hypothetical protein